MNIYIYIYMYVAIFIICLFLASQQLARARSARHHPDTVLFNSVLTACAKGGQSRVALALLDEIGDRPEKSPLIDEGLPYISADIHLFRSFLSIFDESLFPRSSKCFHEEA